MLLAAFALSAAVSPLNAQTLKLAPEAGLLSPSAIEAAPTLALPRFAGEGSEWAPALAEEPGSLSDLRSLAAADDELPDPSAPEAAEAKPSLTRYNKMLVALKHYLRGRGYFNALRALAYARQYHNGKRKDGVTPEFEHQLSIALYVTTLKDLTDGETALTAALLHDVVEDYDVSPDQIGRLFGPKVQNIVWLLTKEFRGVKKDPAKYFADIAADPIASVVKGADRVHNVQSMVGVFGLQKQKEYVAEVERWFLPMLKTAANNFPEQDAAYQNIRHMLRSQLQLVKAYLAAQR